MQSGWIAAITFPEIRLHEAELPETLLIGCMNGVVEKIVLNVRSRTRQELTNCSQRNGRYFKNKKKRKKKD